MHLRCSLMLPEQAEYTRSTFGLFSLLNYNANQCLNALMCKKSYVLKTIVLEDKAYYI